MTDMTAAPLFAKGLDKTQTTKHLDNPPPLPRPTHHPPTHTDARNEVGAWGQDVALASLAPL